MKVTALDFETYYSQEFTLKKLTPVEYILDPRFESIGCAVKSSGETPFWVDGPDIQKYFDQADPDGLYMSHNWLFDGCIVAWRYGFVPKRMADTLGISRACLGHLLRSLSLAKVSEHLGLPPKGDTVLKVIGMGYEAIRASGLYEEYKAYSMHDAELCMGIFDKLVRTGEFPVSELAVMDMVLRCAIKPRFGLDANVLAEHLNDVRQKKSELLARAMLSGAEGVASLQSADQFAQLLRDKGVRPPTKVSKVTQKVTWAFAKSDPEFTELLEHENPAVQALVSARLGHKSTLEETRTERLLSISRLEWPGMGQCALMPVPLRFSGGHTHRLSGDWQLNLQNLPTRGDSNALRRSLVAYDGEEVVTVDARQIEARIVAWVCGQIDLCQAFEEGEDVYSSFASEIFGYPVNAKEHKGERFVGKTGILGLGFGVSWETFQAAVRSNSLAQTGTLIELSDDDAHKAVTTYRTRYPAIPAAWKDLNYKGIPVLAQGGTYSFGPCEFEKGAVKLPSGLRLKYHDLQSGTDGWSYTYGGRVKRLYGAALLENIVQALARICTMDAGVRIQKRIAPMDLWLNLQCHDELVYLAPTEQVPELKKIVHHEMSQRPRWGQLLPLDAETGSGLSYGDAK
jgi:DNA polymerase